MNYLFKSLFPFWGTAPLRRTRTWTRTRSWASSHWSTPAAASTLLRFTFSWLVYQRNIATSSSHWTDSLHFHWTCTTFRCHIIIVYLSCDDVLC